MKKHILLICILVLSAGLSLGLASCGGSGGSASGGDSSPSAQTEAFLQAIKDEDTETMQNVYVGGIFEPLASERPEGEDEYTALYDLLEEKVLGFDYEIAGESIDGDTATVDVKITTYEIAKALTSFIKELILEAFDAESDMADMTDAEIEMRILEMMSDKLEALEEKDFKETVTLSLSQKDGVWMVDEIAEDDPFYDALTGGSGDFGQELEEALEF